VILGVTGHQDLPDDLLAGLQERLHDVLVRHEVEAVVSCLARGADQVVTRAVLDRGGALDAVLPCHDYRDLFEGASLAAFDDLVGRAEQVTELPYPTCSEEAFLAGGLVVVERCDLLLAVWDGHPARGLGGTEDVVSYARVRGRRTLVTWA